MKDFNYLKEKRRMLDSLGRTGRGCDGVQCKECPLGSSNNEHGCRCKEYETKYPEEATEIIRKWAEEHPQKTLLQDFLEKYPYATTSERGVPSNLCPSELGFTDIDVCEDGCLDCWNRPLEEVEK